MGAEKRSILLIEDAMPIAKMRAEGLEAQGYLVAIARDGAGALDRMIAAKPRFDLALIDLDLDRGPDGIEIARRLLAIRDIPLVFLTNADDPDRMMKAEALGAYGILPKGSAPILGSAVRMALQLFEARKGLEIAIEQRVLAEEEAKRGAEKYRSLFENAQVAMFRSQADGSGIVDANQKFLRVFGFSREEALTGPSTLRWADVGSRDRLLSRLRSEGRVVDFECRLFDRGGKVLTCLCSLRLFPESGILEGSLRDVTMEREAMVALSRSERRFHGIYDESPIALELYDGEGALIDVNKACLALFGVDSVAAVRSFRLFDDPNIPAKNKALLRSGASTRYEVAFDFDLVRDLRLYETSRSGILDLDVLITPMVDGEGRVTEYLAQILDITERKKAERRLLVANETLSDAMDLGNVAWWEMEIGSGAVSFHEKKARMLGRNPADFHHYTDFTVLLHPEDREAAMEAMRAHLEGRKARYEVEYRIRDAEGILRWFKDLGRVIEVDKDGRPSRVRGIVTDITEQKREREKLKERVHIYHALFEMNGAVKLLLDPEDGTIVDANPAAARFYGWSESELRKKRITDITILDSAEVLAEMVKAKEGSRERFYFRHRLADGSERDVEVYSNPIVLEGRTYLHSIVHDITERRRDEERIRQLLAEKELLLKEVHHRIKNNMNTAISLLSLQAIALEDAVEGSIMDPSKILKDAMSRLEIMSVLYDKIYRSQDMTALPLGEYLPALAKEIIGIFGEGAGVALEARIEDIRLDFKLLTTVGIMLNELVTNSMKYAFAGIESPVIALSVTRSEGAIRLVYEDNGRGLPQGFSLDASAGFGMRLLKSLVEQAQGGLAVEPARGARFAIHFPL